LDSPNAEILTTCAIVRMSIRQSLSDIETKSWCDRFRRVWAARRRRVGRL